MSQKRNKQKKDGQTQSGDFSELIRNPLFTSSEVHNKSYQEIWIQATALCHHLKSHGG